MILYESGPERLQGESIQVKSKLTALLVMTLLSVRVLAQTVDDCVEERLKTAEPTVTVGELRSECVVQVEPHFQREPVALRRLGMEERTEWNPFVITPHKQNYILPFTYMKEPNNESYRPS